MTGGRSVGWIAALAAVSLMLTLPSGASALSTSSATDQVADEDDLLKATAKCKAGQHVVSGGWRAADNDWAVISRAKGKRRWTATVEGVGPLTVFAYCGAKPGVKERARTRPTLGPSGTPTHVASKCHRGERLVAGGFQTVAPADDVSALVAFKSRKVGARAWKVSVFGDIDVPPPLRVYAYCAKRVDVAIRSRRSEPLPDNTAGSAKARCRKGETLLSGGYSSTPKSDYSNTTGPDFFYSQSARAGARSWRVAGHNYSQVAGRIIAYAYCLS